MLFRSGSNWFWRKINSSLAEVDFYMEDVKNTSGYKNIDVYNIVNLSKTDLKKLLNDYNVTICAWCFSERSKDIIKAIK